MTASQQRVLDALAVRPMSARGVAHHTNTPTRYVQHSLDALYRRSLVTLDDRGWTITDRGRKKKAAA